jgi:hypothetical protein
MPTRDEITTALTEQRERIESWFHTLSEADMRRQMTESEIEGGERWTPKDHLAHVIGSERFFQGAIKRAIGEAEDPLGFYTQAGTDDPDAIRNLINQSNERATARFRETTSEALFARLDETRQATLALLASLDDAQLAQTIAHSHFGDSTIGALFMTVAQHGRMHLKWLKNASAEHGAEHDTQNT